MGVCQCLAVVDNMLGVYAAVVVVGTGASCPGNMELINQKCYLYGTATSRDDALQQCKAADPNNHLWIINHKLEMDQVMEWFSKKKLISPWAWTDGVKSRTRPRISGSGNQQE